MSELKETSQPNEAQEDLDRAKIEDSMKGLRQQQERELQEDLEKFNNRPKPPYYEADAKPETSPNPEIKRENPDPKDLDLTNIQASMQGLREQQDQNFPADFAEINKREQPPYMDTSNPSSVNEGVHWEDRGIIDVPVNELPWPENVNSPQDFNHHISYPDATQATRELQAMKPLIEQGFTSDDFARLDQENGLDKLNGQQRIYDLYYGSDPVRVGKDGNNYIIDKGRHRIYAAKEQGLDFLPAKVKEKVQNQGDN